MDYSLSKTTFEIRVLIFMLNKLIKRDSEKRLDASGHGITGLQYGVMKVVVHSPTTLSTLARKMLVEPATLVPVIDALERRGFTSRTPDRMDRRKNYLTITESGTNVLKDLPLVDNDDALARAVRTMSTQKQKDLLSLLKNVVNGITNNTNMTDEISELASKE